MCTINVKELSIVVYLNDTTNLCLKIMLQLCDMVHCFLALIFVELYVKGTKLVPY